MNVRYWVELRPIEIGVLRRQHLDRRIDDPKRLHCESSERQSNVARSRIK